MRSALVCKEAVVAMQPPGRSATAAGEYASKLLGIKALLCQRLHSNMWVTSIAAVSTAEVKLLSSSP